MSKKWITKKDKNGNVKHIPIEEKKTRKEDYAEKKEKIEWYTDTDFAYTDVGIEKATVYRAGVKSKNRCYEITVYPLKLVNEDAKGWDYRIITTTNNGRVIEDYDAGAEYAKHFKNAHEAKIAAMKTLRDMLD
jgi:hypothetical protein